MVDAGREVDFRWFERVVGGKVDREEENAARVWAITLLLTSYQLPATSKHPRLAILRLAGSCEDRNHYDSSVLTGPMIVACQWNCEITSSQSKAHVVDTQS